MQMNNLRKLLDSNTDIYKTINKDGTINYKYTNGGVDFSKREVRLARGLCLDGDKIVTVGYEKFFCINQLDTKADITEDFKEEFTHLQSDKNTPLKCVEKLDGTMIIVGVYRGNLVFSTTSSRYNDFTDIADRYFNSLHFISKLKSYLIERDSLFVFEYISKYNKIGVLYDTDLDFVLLDEISRSTQRIIDIEHDFGFTRPKIEYKTLEELNTTIKTATNIEGYVVKNAYGRLIKIKTDWWYKEHFDSNMFSNPKVTLKEIRLVVSSIINDNIDELYSIQNSNETYKKINKIGKIELEYNKIIASAVKIANRYLTSKDIVENEPISLERGVALSLKRGKQPDNTRDYFTKEISRRLICLEKS